jgi:lipopolysaccharide export LptBFGC system permease protein LptF
MINYILIALGAVFAIIGIILFVKKIGDKNASKVKFLGAELETGSSSLVIFIIGAALIVFGARVNNKDSESIKPNDAITDNSRKDSVTRPTTDTTKRDTSIHNTTPVHPVEPDHPFKEFTLAAGQQHVMNDLQITLTLPVQFPLSTTDIHTKTVKIRIWRNISHPLSDTAALDASGGGSGVEMQMFILNAIIPVSITDVGQFKFYVFYPVMINKRVASVQVKMYRN